MTGRTTSKFSAPPNPACLTDHLQHPTMIDLPGGEAMRESASSPSPRALSTLILDPAMAHSWTAPAFGCRSLFGD